MKIQATPNTSNLTAFNAKAITNTQAAQVKGGYYGGDDDDLEIDVYDLPS